MLVLCKLLAQLNARSKPCVLFLVVPGPDFAGGGPGANIEDGS